MSERHPSTTVLIVIYLLLMVLLGTTVAAAEMNLGGWLNFVAAAGIAVTKAVLILLFFMHLRYSSQLIWMAAAAAFVWLGILIALMLNDYLTRDQLARAPAGTNQIHAATSAGVPLGATLRR